MTLHESRLPGVLVVEPRVFRDERGFFLERYHAARYAEAGIGPRFVQDNRSHSDQGVLRGLHFQRCHPQGKLVEVTRGHIFDVVVDLRPDSATYGEWEGHHLTDERPRQLWVPPGFAHGFCVLSDGADVLYKCTELYHPDDEGGLRWNDPALGIEWPIAEPLLSAKDRALPTLDLLGPEDLPDAAVAVIR